MARMTIPPDCEPRPPATETWTKCMCQGVEYRKGHCRLVYRDDDFRPFHRCWILFDMSDDKWRQVDTHGDTDHPPFTWATLRIEDIQCSKGDSDE